MVTPEARHLVRRARNQRTWVHVNVRSMGVGRVRVCILCVCNSEQCDRGVGDGVNSIHTMLQQSFPYQLLLFQCWGPCVILHWTLNTETCSHKRHTEGKTPRHTWLAWVKVLVRRSLYTRSLTGLLKFGPGTMVFSIPINLTMEKNSGKRRGNKQSDKGYSGQGDAKNLRGLE